MKLVRAIFFFWIFLEFLPLPGITQNVNQDEILGKWEVVKVTENEKDITSSVDNNAQRWIEFVSDDRYNSDGYPFGRYEGEYLLDETSGSLHLKSGSTGTKGMMWKASYDGEFLILKGTGQLQLYKFILRKIF